MFKRKYDELKSDLNEYDQKKVCVSLTDMSLDNLFYYFNVLMNDKENPIDLTNEPQSIVPEPGSNLEKECIDYFQSVLSERMNYIPQWVLDEVEGLSDDEDEMRDIAREDNWNDLFDFDN